MKVKNFLYVAPPIAPLIPEGKKIIDFPTNTVLMGESLPLSHCVFPGECRHRWENTAIIAASIKRM